MKKMIASVLVLLALVCVNVYPQNSEVKTGIVGQKISNFTLPTYQGQEFSMQSLRGKNVLFIVSRGKYADAK